MANTTWKVTNATTKKNLVVINASVDSDPPGAFYYNQRTTLLPFSTGNYLAPGKNGTITIPDASRDSGGFKLPFTFIVAEAETLAPIKAVNFLASHSDLHDLIVDDSTIDEIAQSFDFYKNIVAVPSSDLAEGYAAALCSTEPFALDNFFNNQPAYKNVSFDMLLLVQSYYNALPYGWVNGKDTVIYLYNESFDEGTDEDHVKSIGTITITGNWSEPLPLVDDSSFKMELKLNGKQTTPLCFSDGMFRDSLDENNTKVCLKASFFIPRLTWDDDDTNQIITCLSGYLNNYNSVFGYENDEPDGIDDDGSQWKLQKSHNINKAVKLLLIVFGVLAGMFVPLIINSFIQWCRKLGNPEVDPATRAAEAEQLKEDIITKTRSDMQALNKDIVVPEQKDISSMQRDYKTEQLEMKTNDAFRNIEKMVTSQEEMLSAIGNKCSNAAAEAIADRIDYIRRQCEAFDVTSPESIQQFREQMPDTIKALSANATDISSVKGKIANKLTELESESYNKAIDVFDNIFKVQQRLEEDMKDIEEGRDEREIIEEPIIED